jgi:hypothetical protein
MFGVERGKGRGYSRFKKTVKKPPRGWNPPGSVKPRLGWLMTILSDIGTREQPSHARALSFARPSGS